MLSVGFAAKPEYDVKLLHLIIRAVHEYIIFTLESEVPADYQERNNL